MSFAGLIEGFLRTRANNATLRMTPFGIIEEARAADALFPGTLAMRNPNAEGGFVVIGAPVLGLGARPDAWTAVTTWLKQNGFGIRRIGLDPAAPGFVGGTSTRTIDAGSPPAFVKTAWSLRALPVSNAYRNAQAAITRLIDTRIAPLNLLTSDVLSGITNLIDAGYMPYPRERNPIWAADAQQTKAWNDIVDFMSSIIKKYDRDQLDAGFVELTTLNNNADFWGGVQRGLTAVATLGLSELVPVVRDKWNEMLEKMKLYRKTRAAALAEANAPTTAPARAALLRAKITELDSSIGGTIINQTANIPGLRDTINQQAEGLGNPIAIFAGLGTAAQIAILVAIIAAITSAIVALNELGVFAAVGALATSAKAIRDLVGKPAFGLALLAGIGFILYQKYVKK